MGEDRRVVGLLAALVALVSVLALAVVGGGILLWREYGRTRAALEAATGSGTSARELALEVSRRQDVAARELAAVARDASRQIEEFERRAERLRERQGGAIAAASRAVELSALMADEMLLQLKLMATLHSVLEKAARPLDPQRSLLEGAEPEGGSSRRDGRAAR